jgi:BirA family biotin operon repressor/biotin-[acetyl-CoA-carboxylase] ligase
MTLATAFDALSTGAVARYLSTQVLGRALVVREACSSTNADALQLAHDGAADGTVVVAEAQTAGRGRLGRQWFSPARRNLHVSVILTRLPPALRWPWIPLVSAVSAARAIQVLSGSQATVKWPNDILIGVRKVGGILCETGSVGEHGVVVVGIGVNVNTRLDDFPADLREVATSLLIEQQRPFDRSQLLAAMLSELELRRDDLLRDPAGHFMDEYRIRCSTLGERVRIELGPGRSVIGKAVGVNDDGSLRLAAEPDATPIDIRAGDVMHLRGSPQRSPISGPFSDSELNADR